MLYFPFTNLKQLASVMLPEAARQPPRIIAAHVYSLNNLHRISQGVCEHNVTHSHDVRSTEHLPVNCTA
jgi:hypothetical protein